MVPQKFNKQLKVFEKAESERIPVKKPWDHAINLREDFIPRKGRMYLISREEKEKVRETVKERVYLTLKVILDFTSLLCRKKGQKEKNGIRLQIS